MNILVLGAGAMGSAVGGFMARAGHDVVLLGREAHVAAVRAQGLRITGIWGEHTVRNLAACTDIADAPCENPDLIIIAVKSYDTASAARLAAQKMGDATLVCSYQNGLGNAETIAKELGWDRVLGARVIFGARINQPGEVEITVIAEPTAVGAYQGGTLADCARTVAKAMDAAGLPTVYTDRIQTILWSKVAYNCALNPLSALLDVPYGVLAEREHTRSFMNSVIRELYAVGNAMSIPLEPQGAEAYITRFYEKLLPPTAAHYASMREDLKRQRRTEIDALNGCIVRFGAEHGIPCPANALLTDLIHAREITNGNA